MRRDDRDGDRDPFDDLFRQLERMMNEMMGGGMDMDMDMHVEGSAESADAHTVVYEDEADVRVVVDLPGIEKEGISLECDGRTLGIDAASEHREYDERVRLPARVNEHAANATFNNGVLEVVFERADTSADINVD